MMNMRHVLFVLLTICIGFLPMTEGGESLYFSQEHRTKDLSLEVPLYKNDFQNHSVALSSALRPLGCGKRPQIIVVSGTLNFSFYPKASGGTGGDWQPIIISPSGRRIVGPVVPYDSLDPFVMEVNVPTGDLIETGYWGIELKNNIVNVAPSDFLDSLFVECFEYEWDTIRCLPIPSSLEGENIVLPYLVLVPDQDKI